MKRAREVEVQGLGEEEVCEKLRTAFEGREDEFCEEFSGKEGWKGVEVRAEFCLRLGLEVLEVSLLTACSFDRRGSA